MKPYLGVFSPFTEWLYTVEYVNVGKVTLRKHAYSNILKILQPRKENFQIKNSDKFSYFCSKYENNVYPCKPQFYYIKVEFKGIKII